MANLQIEKQVHEVNRLRIANQKNRLQPSNKLSLPTADQDKENGGGSKKHETFRREAASSKRMAELARQFGSLLRQVLFQPFWEDVLWYTGRKMMSF